MPKNWLVMDDMVQNVKDDGSTRRWRTRLVVAVLALMAAGQANAAVTGLGTFNTPTKTGDTWTGTFKTDNGVTGSYKLTLIRINGYNGATVTGSSNGLEIKNNGDSSIHFDRFSYRLDVKPDAAFTNIPLTVKLTQTGNTTGGNSEVAKQTLSYTQGPAAISVSAKLTSNPKVTPEYNAMGDYFMATYRGVSNNYHQITSNDTSITLEQIRYDDSNNSKLYFFRFPDLNVYGNPTVGATNQAIQISTKQTALTFKNQREHWGVLPPSSVTNGYNIDDYFKDRSTLNANTYKAMPAGTNISSGGSYVSYGMLNSKSSYIIDIINPASVTIDYQAIMNGSSQSAGDTIGETVNEWITFGITSPAPFYSISGKVYHDANANGTLDSGETGLGGVTVKLTDCNGTQKNTTTTASDGSYSFDLGTSLPSTALCVVEPNNLPNYLFDTTPNTIKLALSNTQYSYPNNNFGDSTISPLTLNKYQAANDCNITNLTTLTYSKQPISLTKEQRGQCIAYRIEAVNTGSTALTNVVINDPLMNDAQRVNKLYTQSAQPTLCGSDNTSSSTCDTKKASYNTDEQGVTTITTSGFGLPGSGNNKSANLYFNTKYQIK